MKVVKSRPTDTDSPQATLFDAYLKKLVQFVLEQVEAWDYICKNNSKNIKMIFNLVIFKKQKIVK